MTTTPPSADPVSALLPDVANACRAFRIDGELAQIEAFERGHIHDTFISTWNGPGGATRFLHQRLNHRVFADVAGLMNNVSQVTRHLEAQLGDVEGFHTLSLVEPRAGGSYLQDERGAYWRTYHFIEDTTAFDVCESEARAHEAASVFGRFQQLLLGIDVGALHETIPNFFSLPYRMQQLEEAIAADAAGRVALASTDIAFALGRRDLISVVDEATRAGHLPRRVVHGDTKLNNVLFSAQTGRAVAVVDLDTCMPAWSLYDFGDLVRFTAARHAEDETDLTKVGIDLDLYRALVSGYLEHAADFLTPHERELMPDAARIVTFMIGLRFLTDYLAGDVYFKTTHETHNLVRCRTQFGMVGDMERRAADLRQIVAG